MMTIRSGPVAVDVDPMIGGALTGLRFHGRDVLRPTRGQIDVPTRAACFPLVPFSNRIGWGRFEFGGRRVVLPPDVIANGAPHALHGLGWAEPWAVLSSQADRISLTHRHDGSVWPWPYDAVQEIRCGADYVTLRLVLTNSGPDAMPGGLGFHPYFPVAGARIHARFSGLWENDDDHLPRGHIALTEQPDWLGAGGIDHIFTGRQGPILIEGKAGLCRMDFSGTLPMTCIYHPPAGDFFCVEPVSHMTDAVNRREPASVTGLQVIAPGASLTAKMRLSFSDAARAD